MSSTSKLSVENLKKQLEIEMSATLHDTGHSEGEGSSIPVMECLRSPTTRTVLAIASNQNHFEVIKEFVLDAEQEERETQELVDAAEATQAVPISSAFQEALRESLKGDTIKFFLPRNAAGDVFGVHHENSTILNRWGSKPVPDATDDDPEALNAPIEFLSPSRMSHRSHRDDDGSGAARRIEERTEEPTASTTGPPGDASKEMPVLRAPTVDIATGKAIPQVDGTSASPSKRQLVALPAPEVSLKEMLKQQQQELKERERSYQSYSQMVSEFTGWQDKRMAVFSALLEPAAEDTTTTPSVSNRSLSSVATAEQQQHE